MIISMLVTAKPLGIVWQTLHKMEQYPDYKCFYFDKEKHVIIDRVMFSVSDWSQVRFG